MIEVASASIVLWRIASLRGSGRLHLSEQAGLRFVGGGFLVLSTSIAADALQALRGHETPQESVLGIVVAALSVLFMPILGRMKKSVGGEIHSEAMKADAKQTHFCAYLAGITLIGLALNSLMGWWWADSVSALCMVPIIGWEGIQALRGKACGCASCS
jgi:divalent metal cation (Fe/Co/Zn/Cd) transporter